MPGYLTPVYEGLLQHFAAAGYDCSSSMKEPSKFWRRLWATQNSLLSARRILVTIGVAASLALAVLTYTLGW
jgi:hypothetical protein